MFKYLPVNGEQDHTRKMLQYVWCQNIPNLLNTKGVAGARHTPIVNFCHTHFSDAVCKCADIYPTNTSRCPDRASELTQAAHEEERKKKRAWKKRLLFSLSSLFLLPCSYGALTFFKGLLVGVLWACLISPPPALCPSGSSLGEDGGWDGGRGLPAPTSGPVWIQSSFLISPLNKQH